MGNWELRGNVENGEDDRMCKKCYNGRPGNIRIGRYGSRVDVADDFVEISETPEGLQRQIDKKWRVEFKRKWDEEELPIADKLEISRNCCWDAHINKVTERSKA